MNYPKSLRPEGAHTKNSSVRKSSMFDIRGEMIRMPHACIHVAKPLPPLVLFGMKPEDTRRQRLTRAEWKEKRVRPKRWLKLMSMFRHLHPTRRRLQKAAGQDFAEMYQ